MAEVKFHIWEGKMVHAVYSDVVEEALTEGITAETIIAAMSESAESGQEIPELAELRALNVHCKPLVVAGEAESGESAAAQKYVVRAVLRYVPVAESESL